MLIVYFRVQGEPSRLLSLNEPTHIPRVGDAIAFVPEAGREVVRYNVESVVWYYDSPANANEPEITNVSELVVAVNLKTAT